MEQKRHNEKTQVLTDQIQNIVLTPIIEDVKRWENFSVTEEQEKIRQNWIEQGL